MSLHANKKQSNSPLELSCFLLTTHPFLPILSNREKKNKLGFGVGIKGALRLVTDNAFTSTEGVIKKMKNTVSTFTQDQVFFFLKWGEGIFSSSLLLSVFLPPPTSLPTLLYHFLLFLLSYTFKFLQFPLHL